MFLQKLDIANADFRIEIFFTKELDTKIVFGFQKYLSVAFHVQSCVIRHPGDNHYQWIMRQYFVKFVKS